MKKILFVVPCFFILFFSCDNNHDQLPDVYFNEELGPEMQYMASIMDACDDGTRTSYCIYKEEWERLTDELSSKPGPSANCGGRWTITFRDRDGIERTGFSDGMNAGPDECILNM